MSRYLRSLLVFLLATLGAKLVLSGSGDRLGEDLLVIRESYIEFPGRLYAHSYEGHGERYAGHHAITYEGGGAADKAFLRTPIHDREIAAALAKIGLDAGGGIHEAAWSQRFDRARKEPDTVAEGDPLEVLVRWGAKAWMPLESLLQDRGGSQGLDLRFQDNRRWIATYGSGCVICLCSCPGAKIGNRNYSMRQNEIGPMDFHPVRDLDFPPDGTPVRVRMGRPGTLLPRR